MKTLSYVLSLPVRVLITIIFILVIVAVGLGWGVRRALDRPDGQLPTTTIEATVPPAAPQNAATPTPLVQPPATFTAVPATLTPVPTTSPTTVTSGEWETVQTGEGLFMVCRRYCQGRWPPDDDALTTYARAVAELNALAWPPALSVGQRLQMPPCPAR